jgi:PAS domain S-box-containing protein
VFDRVVGLSSSDFVAILDSLLEGFQVIDHEFRYLHLNEVAVRHSRSSRAALLGRTMMECYPGIENTEMFRALRRCLDERTSHIMENEFTYPDGSTAHFELRIEPVPQGICVLSLDVSERKAAERALRQSEARLSQVQRMEAIGQLAAGIAHDFNNLLAVVIGEAERSLAHPNGPTRDEVETILAAARTSVEMTRQLLAIGRNAPLERKVVHLRSVVLGLERFLRPALTPRIELRVDISEKVGPVDIDRSKLEQVLLNLVFNARDAIDARGCITIALSSVELDSSEARFYPGLSPGRYVVMSVADTGAGMDRATQNRIFDPFFTTKDGGRGTGLGLATLYGIVRQHGGSVWVYSELGAGSTFKVYLPEVPGDVAAAASDSGRDLPKLVSSKSAPNDGMTILVAEDDEVLRRLFDNVLSNAGFRVLMAASGDEALALWDEAGDSIQLLMTDARMPGMTGAELIERIRQKSPGLAVICTSGLGQAYFVGENALPADVLFVEKPFSPRKLVERVRALLAGD